MNELWRDYSAHQDNQDTVREISPQVAIDNGVVGFIMRSGTSWTYKDPTFNYLYDKVISAYKTSYHNFSPGSDVDAQLDNWFEQHPVTDIIPRFAAVEGNYNSLEPYQIAAELYNFSERYKEREGERPGIYTRKQLADLWLTPYLDPDWLNEHWWWIAQYDARRDTEEFKPIIPPNGVLLERCWLKQTADQMEGFSGEAESGFVDRNRFQFENMDEWVTKNFGDLTNPVGECGEFQEDIAQLALGASVLSEKLKTLEQGQLEITEDVMNLEAEAIFWDLNIDQHNELVGVVNDMDRVVQANAVDIEKTQEDIEGLYVMGGDQDGLINALKNRVDVLDAQIDVSRIDMGHRISGLSARIDGLQGGHNQLVDKVEQTGDYFEDRVKDLYKKLDTHSHTEPVGGTFWQRLRWLITGRTSV